MRVGKGFVRIAVAVLGCTAVVAASAQSSGSINYGSGTTVCDLNNTNGNITCENGPCLQNVKTTIKTNSGSGNVFVVRPSAVVALLTDVTVNNKTSTSGTSSAYAGVDFQVNVTPLSGQSQTPTVIPNFPITYDARFIQLSTNLFNAITGDCGDTVNGCFITFNESTASAHSFDFLVTGLQSGSYGIEVDMTQSLGNIVAPASAMTCVGPVNLTVEQNKVFQASTGISF